MRLTSRGPIESNAEINSVVSLTGPHPNCKWVKFLHDEINGKIGDPAVRHETDGAIVFGISSVSGISSVDMNEKVSVVIVGCNAKNSRNAGLILKDVDTSSRDSEETELRYSGHGRCSSFDSTVSLRTLTRELNGRLSVVSLLPRKPMKEAARLLEAGERCRALGGATNFNSWTYKAKWGAERIVRMNWLILVYSCPGMPLRPVNTLR